MQEISTKEIYKREVGASEMTSLDVEPDSLDLPESIVVHSLTGKIKLMRLEDSVAVASKFVAEVGLICDRCLDNFDTTVVFSFEREYLFDRKQVNENEEEYVDKYLNVDMAPAIREELILAIPSKNLCKNTCEGICQTCGVNLNHGKCNCKI